MSGVARTIEAAGGVVEQEGLIAVVHRPRYDDWSLPKGKLDKNESSERAALREVQEETGLSCQLVEELAPVSYTDNRGRPKNVRYWRMKVLRGQFEVNDEVDELRWLSKADALELLSYEHDRELVAALVG
ncbi:MAG: NUDIX hydrolase [Solirubrobacteraceae bacterium]|jgi:8-oxo-dGTP diphosphatase|nr:NUDIX hydrolase [Solirubrobacteraceae bacterium]MDP4672607.1 NUDIX hydrolase [Solirubrobacteraceae bacterium]MDP4921048.1 NUDIX hydrolase [Solirubrobacteraceae bacterium]MDP5033344.1 NUDIX hydrolase [Solirubrobacteraceae bacterium]